MTRLGPWALALTLGGAGGALFAALDLPLPWMLGALTANTIAALSGLTPEIPRPLRAIMIGVLGLMLGSAFAPEMLDRVGRWSGSMAVLLAAMVVTTLVVVVYLRRVAGMSVVTAYFAGAPGGINEMVITGGAFGGDERAIALSHALRILFIVFTVPFGYRLVAHVHTMPMAQSMGRLLEVSAADAAILAACAILGAAVARLLRFPAWVLTGPMITSAVVHLAGLTSSHPPAELVIAAQVVTGSGIGARFRGLGWGEVAAQARPALGATALMLAVSAGAAAGLAAVSDLPFALLLLSFVPGGIAEMCLVALALGQDVAFVSTHHVVRVVMVIVLAPLAFRLFRKTGAGQ
ncbi:putative ammonia monooxygenase [Candidatus Terasakiella magnetica]|nr:putative ammonia monooxygenase [Candidatus Terasakiella magnetica]